VADTPRVESAGVPLVADGPVRVIEMSARLVGAGIAG
jgi:hypothetical protein